MSTQGEIPLYIDGSNHQAFVRYELALWPTDHHRWSVYCPACDVMQLASVDTFVVAASIALDHRIDEDAVLPPQEMVHGPLIRWGPAL